MEFLKSYCGQEIHRHSFHNQRARQVVDRSNHTEETIPRNTNDYLVTRRGSKLIFSLALALPDTHLAPNPQTGFFR